MSDNQQNNMVFSLPMFKNFVPEKMRFWIILCFPIVFQMSDAVFMGLSAHISGSLSLLNNDILMCGFAGMIGVTMTFPLLFRFKFRFTTRQILLIVTLGMVLCNIICLFTRFLPILIVVSFFFGCLKLWGTFECMSCIMMKISPRYNFAPFLTVVFTVVFCSIELSGIIGTHICYRYPWQYMNYFAMTLQLIVALIVITTMKDVRFMPINKLYGIGWLGFFMWAIMLTAFTFIFVYGDYLDWLSSPYIRLAIGIILIMAALNLYRMIHYRHPYLQIPSFRYHNLWNILIIFLIACIIMSSESVLQHIFTDEVLHFGNLNTANLKWFVIIGILIGGFFSTYGIEKLRWSYKTLTFTTMMFLTLYVTCMFFLISPETNIETLYLPSVLYGIGHVMLFIVLTTYVEGIVPLQHRFQVLTILGFVRIGPGAAVGASLYGHFFKAEMNKNLALLGSNVNSASFSDFSFDTIAGEVGRNAIMLSLRNLFGITIILGLITMILIMIGRYQNDIRKSLPTITKAYKIFSIK